MDQSEKHHGLLPENEENAVDSVVSTQRVVLTDKHSLFQIQEKVKPAAEALTRGELAVFPTETVYGLGAGIYAAKGVQRIFCVKGRPADNPLIVHIADINQALDLIHESTPDLFFLYAERFWPGPVTFVVPKSQRVSDKITGGKPSVAIRFPSHPVAQILINSAGQPIAAPSANISGKPSATRPEHLRELEGKVEWIIDNGPITIGLESTIISLLQTPPVLLRPGPITVEKLKEIIPNLEINLKSSKALAPGMKYRHYAPEAAIAIIPWTGNLTKLAKDTEELYLRLRGEDKEALILATAETINYHSARGYSAISMGSRSNLYSIAQNLFHSLRTVDALGYRWGIIEGFEEVGLGLALMNRIEKASSGHF
ncbi:MAG TPA: L-threonylcarbamoyladenylate synthase [Thermotogota bacterium]|nr:L-threonylcarbamoyladenylate synthase [Thermotogota bacterium]